MFWCARLLVCLASRSKRCLACGSNSTCGRRIFSATVRPRRRSTARKTSLEGPSPRRSFSGSNWKWANLISREACMEGGERACRPTILAAFTRKPALSASQPRAVTPARASPQEEPRPSEGPVLLEESDFRALAPPLAANPDYNANRLAARRKLLALGKRVALQAGELGLALECRTSLHHPHQFNGNRVQRLWAYLTRSKKEKSALKRELGAELGKDLDSAYRNAYLCLALESTALEVSLRIHPDGWYDGQNLVNRVKREGLRPWLAVLNQLEGFRLRLHDWKGEFRCG